MLHMLLPNDVLLKGRPALQQLLSGNQEYNDHLRHYRSPFAHLPREQKQEIVHTIMATIWSQNGRFLQHVSAPGGGTISILSNEQAEKIVYHDLKFGKQKQQPQEVKDSGKKKSAKKESHPSKSSNVAVKKAANSNKKNKYYRRHSGKSGPSKPRANGLSPKQCPLPIHNPFAVPTTDSGKLFGRSVSGTRFGDV